MTITQQVEQVITAINELRQLYPDGEELAIHPKDDLPDIPIERIDLILKRLQDREQIIKYVQEPVPPSLQLRFPDDKWFHSFIVKVIGERFDNHLRILGLTPTPKTPPKGWSLEEAGNSALIKRYDKVLYTFKTTWARKYLIFKRLWRDYNNIVSYKDLRSTISNSENSKISKYKLNRGIRSDIYKLKDEPEFQKLPIKFETKKGIKVFVEEISPQNPLIPF